MKKVIIFVMVGVLYISVALGASWANNSGAVDNVIDFLGLQHNSSIASDDAGTGIGNSTYHTPSNVPIPPPPSPPPNVNPTVEIS